MELFLLVLFGALVGFVSTNTGGGSLVMIPLMVALGYSPQTSIATTRLSAIGGMIAGLHLFHKEKKIDYRLAYQASLLSIAGALVGAFALTQVPSALLLRLVGVFTLALAALSFVKKRPAFGALPSKRAKRWGFFTFFLTGLWGGFYGGAAILSTYVYTLFFHKTMTESLGTRKITGLLVNFAALLIYGINSYVDWSLGLTLFLGVLIGSYFGTRWGLKKGDLVLERLFQCVAVSCALYLLFL
jgi:uncharacterized membrane protein YfcA